MLVGLDPGDVLARREVHERFGGRRQGGISPSREAAVVMFFTDPVTGQKHGYYDGVDADGLFNYVGEGQKGDQQFVQGNRALRDHALEGRTVEGFEATGTRATYLGQFDVVDWYFRDAHETGNTDVMRQVIVFRLRPHSPLPTDMLRTPITTSDKPVVAFVPVEENRTERAFVAPDREPYEAERAESSLVQKYKRHLEARGHQVERLQVIPPGEGAPLFCDLWDHTTGELVEAKGGITREHIRMAVGQLLDYGRFVDYRTRAVLLPSCPRTDVINYLHTLEIGLVYSSGEGWERPVPPPGC